MERAAAFTEARDADRRSRPTSRSILRARGGRDHPRECERLGVLGGRRFDRLQRDRSPPGKPSWPRCQLRCIPRFICPVAHGGLRRDLDPSSGVSTLSSTTCH
jgi:hypothetical protein